MTNERPHGYSRYVLDSCRDTECVQAFIDYNERVEEAEQVNAGSPFIRADLLRTHLAKLEESGLNLAEVSQLAWVTPEFLAGVVNPRWIKVSAHLGLRLLAVPIEEQPPATGALWEGDYVWAMIDGLVAAGWTKSRIARDVLGDKQLQLSRSKVRVGKAVLIERAYRREVGDPAELRSISSSL